MPFKGYKEYKEYQVMTIKELVIKMLSTPTMMSGYVMIEYQKHPPNKVKFKY
jgi:hypothetical protein